MDPQTLMMLQFIFGNQGGSLGQFGANPTIAPNTTPVNQNLMNNTGASSYVTVDPSWISPATNAQLPYQMANQEQANSYMQAGGQIPKGHFLSSNGQIYEDVSARNPLGNPNPGQAADYLQDASPWEKEFAAQRQAMSQGKAFTSTTNPGLNYDPSKPNSGYQAANSANVTASPGTPASPSAVNTLTGQQPNLGNRRPSLAAGWGGWDSTSTNGPQGSANFTYYSRFA